MADRDEPQPEGTDIRPEERFAGASTASRPGSTSANSSRRVRMSTVSSVVDAPEPTLDLPVATAQPVELIEGAARPGWAVGANGAPDYGEWIVPWDDGLLVGSMSFSPQPLPDELPEDVLALFPQEVIDLFDGDLPEAIAETTEKRSEAGLLDVVSEIIRDNPAVNEAIYSAPTEAPTLDVRFTVDGTVTVATTTDLSTWTTQDIVVPPPGELPAGINWQVSAQGLVVNENGWVLSVFDSIDADPFALLPAEIQGESNAANGLGVSTDELGITVEYDDDIDAGNSAETRTFTWDELGVAPEAAQLLSEQAYSSTLWAASWDGEPTPTNAPSVGGPIAATAAGFVQWTDQTWFPPDGITWTASPLPDDVSLVSGSFAVDGGVIVMSSSSTDESLVHRVDERGGSAVLLDLPLPVAGSLSAATAVEGPATSGTVVAVDAPVMPEELLSIEVDGYRLAALQPGGVLEVTEVATGEVVVSENPFRTRAGDDSLITFDENGVTVTDPATGGVLVVFSREALDAAESEYFDEGGGEYNPDFWLLASLDGERFVIDDIDDPTDGPTSLATNGTRLLLQSGTDWILYDLA